MGYDDGTRYDPGTMSRVDVDVHVEELEAQIMSSEMPEIKRRGVCNDKALISCLILAFMGITIGLSIGKSGSDKEADNSTNSSKLLPRPPPDLLDVCSLHKLTTVVGYDFCEELCEPANCCKLPAVHQLSCIEENEEKCDLYNAACANLAKSEDDEDEDEDEEQVKVKNGIVAEVPPAPTNLKEQCNPTNLESVEGFMACEDSCLRAECCYTMESSESCYFNNPECLAYSPCMVLHKHEKNSNNKLPKLNPVQAEVAAHCTGDSPLTESEMNFCREVCTPAACCFVTDEDSRKNGVPSCLAEKSDFCHDYTTCQVLYNNVESSSSSSTTTTTTTSTKTVSSTTPKLQHSIKTACSEEEREEPGGLANCEALCAPSYCCFEKTLSHSCADVDCKAYASCGFLHGSKSEALPSDKKSIDTTCSAEYLKDDGDEDCKKQCEQGLCCFAKEHVNCPVQCSDFASCHVLHKREEVIDGMTVSVKAAVDKACTDEDSFVCELMCHTGSCCFGGGDSHNCFNTNCADYAACSAVMSGKGWSGGAGAGAGGESHDTDPADEKHHAPDAEQHEEISDPETPKTQSESVTRDSSPEEDDDDEDEEEIVLEFEVDGEEVIVDLDRKGDDLEVGIEIDEEEEEEEDYDPDHPASRKSVPDQEIKESGNTKDVDAEEEEDEDEEDYDPDHPAVAKRKSASMKSIVEDACSSEYRESSKCEDVCAMGSCCFDDGGSKCDMVCSDFDSCSYVYTDGGGNAVANEKPNDESEKESKLRKELIEMACSEDAIGLAGGKSACQDVCDVGSCCFAEGSNTCSVDCQDYTSCKILYEETATTVPSNATVKKAVDEACSTRSTETLEGTQACEDICRSGSCCFLSIVSSCSPDESKYVNCKDYKACFAVYGQPS